MELIHLFTRILLTHTVNNAAIETTLAIKRNRAHGGKHKIATELLQ